MKVKLFFGLGVLILLSAISIIFNAIPIIGVSAQDYETVDDYVSKYGGNNINEMIESYSYKDPNTNNTDNNDYNNNNYDPSTYEQNSEYSSYNSYENTDYSNYGDSYEYPSNEGYMDGSYSSGDSGLDENQYNYNNNYYAQDSYDSNNYPPKKPQKFTCPDSGLVVDKPESCPVICPHGSALEGHFVAAGSNITKICNVDQQVLETCLPGTDLEGVFVTDATPEQCNIFATCDATTPLGEALGLNATEIVEVADSQLCELSVPEPVQISQCPLEPTTEVPFLNPVMAGENVTSLELCQSATPAVQCGPLTTLNGTWVHPDATETCNLVIPPPFQPFTCEATDPLGIALGGIPVEVVDSDLCELSVPEPVTIFECPATPTTQVPNPNPVMAGENVTSLELCQAATPAVQCLDGSTLEGVWVNPANQTTTCNIVIPPLFRCPATPTTQVTNPNPDLAGANVTDFRLCEAPTAPNICPKGTDLAGHFVNNTATQCNTNISIVNNTQAQCIKCADLGIFQALSVAGTGSNQFNPQRDASADLYGIPPNNVFSICALPTNAAKGTAYNATVTITGGTGTQAIDQENFIQNGFKTCLNNAPVTPVQVLATQGLVQSLQENSLTTNVRSEAEIPTFSSPPTMAQGPGDLTALEKMAKLKQQWMDLLP